MDDELKTQLIAASRMLAFITHKLGGRIEVQAAELDNFWRSNDHLEMLVELPDEYRLTYVSCMRRKSS